MFDAHDHDHDPHTIDECAECDRIEELHPFGDRAVCASCRHTLCVRAGLGRSYLSEARP